jgi:hypothetical protein
MNPRPLLACLAFAALVGCLAGPKAKLSPPTVAERNGIRVALPADWENVDPHSPGSFIAGKGGLSVGFYVNLRGGNSDDLLDPEKFKAATLGVWPITSDFAEQPMTGLANLAGSGQRITGRMAGPDGALVRFETIRFLPGPGSALDAYEISGFFVDSTPQVKGEFDALVRSIQIVGEAEKTEGP